MLIPDNPIVDPVAVVLPAVFAPSRAKALLSAAAPGGATDTDKFKPALLSVIDPDALLPWNVVPVPANCVLL